MKKRFSIVAIILAMDNILTPFSIAFGNDGDIFDIGENVVIENEITESGSPEDIQEEESEIEREEQEASDEDTQWEVWSEEEASEDSQDEEIESLENEEQSITEIEVEQTEREEQWSSIETNDGNIETNDDKTETENSLIDTSEAQTWTLEDTSTISQNNENNTLGWQTRDVITWDIQESLTGIESDDTQTGTSLTEVSEIQTWTQTWSEEDTLEQQLTENEDNQWTWWIVDTITEEIQEIITKIRYFFKKEWDSRYIKYGRDSNNIWTITLKDPKTSTSITIMDKNLWAESVGVGRSSYGYYFQWWNNSGVKTVNWSNKTTEKAIYKDSYYNRGYDGKWMFIVWGKDYWENGDHYNSLWWNESKESSRYGSCPIGYHIPTVKEWNQLLSIWWKIHTQDTTKNETVLRYSADYATKNIHTFKWAATQCAQWENECVDEDKLSIIIETLSEELKLPLAWSYDENGNYEEGLWVYWTTIAKDGSRAWVFDMNVYIWNWADERLQYKSQWHNIRCFQNIYPYEAPVEIEDQGEEELGTWNEINSLDNKEGLENEKQDSYSGKNIPSEFISHTLVLDTTKDFMNVELGANWWKFSDEKESKTVKYGYYNEETTINVDALKQDEYRSGYEVDEILLTPVWYKLMDEIEIPTREWYIFDGWYTEVDWWEKVDFENLLVSEWMKVYAHWTLKEYTITWKNEDGTIRDTTQVAYGQIPIHEDITQPADEKYTYTFKWWEPEIKEVTWDAEYRATYTYTLRKYTVTWKNEDETVLKTEEVEYGTVPTYDGEEPTKESTEEYEYIFTWWDKKIDEVKWDVEYVARYETKEILKEDISTLSHDDENILSWTIEKWSEWSNDLGRWWNIQNSLSNSLELKTWDVESWSALDLLKELLLVQTETWEVLEYTEKDKELELSHIWETLNEKEITWNKMYKNVIVNVEAPIGSFPSVAELRITPITTKSQQQQIKNQLVENTDVTQESELVSFDISFIYTLSNGEVIELQPYTWQTVKVSFNFTYNDTLSQADSDSDKELKVYHLEEVKDESGKKTDEVEVKEVEVNKSESSEWELVVDADKFSVYSVAAVDAPMLRAVQTNQLSNFAYWVITYSWNWQCVTMMDRNLWAIDTWSLWYFYQWWNNYWFTVAEAANGVSTQIDVSSYTEPSTYNDSTFIVSNYWWLVWTDSVVKNLWWWWSDTINNKYGQWLPNYDGRQWPCPQWWHVPSTYEIWLLIQYWWAFRGYTVTPSSNFYYVSTQNYKDQKYLNFLSDFNLDIPGNWYLLKPWLTESHDYFWTSSAPYYTNSRYNWYRLHAANKFVWMKNAYLTLSDWLQVRCFYNSLSCDDIPEPSVSDNNPCDLPWWWTAEDGESVTWYQAATVPYGQSCAWVQATCNNGTWSVNNFGTDYPYSGCTVAEPATCSFQWQTIAHNGSLAVYSSASPTCPTTCTQWTVTCNNGTLWWDTSYTNLSCATVSKTCDLSYTLSSEGSHGTYSSCTPSTANGTICTAGTTEYKLDSCDTGYHTEDGETCIENTRIQNCSTFSIQNATATVSTFTQTWNGSSWTPATKAWTEGGSECGFSCDTNYTWDSTTSTCKADTKQVACDASGTPANATADSYNVTVTWNGSDWSSPSACTWTCNPHYHTWANNNSCEIDTFQITWLDWDGQTLKTNTVDYNVVPSYSGPTPTKAATDQYTYTFNNSWSPALVPATADTIYTAQFTESLNQYTVTITANPNGYGTVSTDSVTADYWTSISENGNRLTLWTTTVIATPMEADVQYTYTFSGWDNTCGNIITWDCTITAKFDREVNRYDVTFDSDGWDYTPTTQSIEYWSTATRPTPDPTKTWYEFSGWTLNWLDFDFSTPIMWTTNLVAKRNLAEYTITYNMNWWTNNPNNPDTYTIESWAITLQQPTKIWYIFLWWTWSNGGVAQTWVIIPSWSDWNKIYNAVWQSSNVEYIVYHYVKRVWQSTYQLAETEIWHWRTDDVLTLSSLSKESQYPCAHYDKWSLTWTEDWPWDIVTEAVIKWDGSTKIYLYYTRNNYTVHLSGDKWVDYLEINGERTTEAVRECGSEVPVNAVPKPWYHFVRWDREENRRSEEEGEGWELPVK